MTKKLLSILMAISLLFSAMLLMTSCNESGVDEGGFTENDWQAMIAEPNFENYTLHQVARLNYGGGMVYDEDVVVKFTKDKMTVEESGDLGFYEEFVDEELAEQRGAYEDVFRALLADFDNYTYDKQTGTYKSSSTVTVELELSTEGLTATVTMENGEVHLTEDGKLEKFTCSFTQDMTIPDYGAMTITTESMAWPFSNYGTTVIEDASE